MAKVLGLGGVFLRALDPKALHQWYHEHLGEPLSEHGQAIFEGDEARVH